MTNSPAIVCNQPARGPLPSCRGSCLATVLAGEDYPTADGTCVRDYIHISDLASAHLLALEALTQRVKLIYNLGNGRGFSVMEVIESARRVTGHGIPARKMARRLGDPPVLVASSQKIRDENCI